ncbi:hypothetical protein [Spongiactinospora sp. 9N601]|uniref:hypothetical protein n=1 Tax=Spongiactinospora sp. 9N601 TaxID=3375149 RepID=UPI0037A6CB64
MNVKKSAAFAAVAAIAFTLFPGTAELPKRSEHGLSVTGTPLAMSAFGDTPWT